MDREEEEEEEEEEAQHGDLLFSLERVSDVESVSLRDRETRRRREGPERGAGIYRHCC